MGSRVAALAALLLALAGGAGAAPQCREDTVWLRGDFGTARFTVDIAATDEDRARGLMFVSDMPQGQGMLFVYDRSQRVAFWMKNTLIPLDIVFADAAGRVIRVQERAVPGDLTPLPGGGLVQYVLEINGGLARRMGIAPGTELRHPAIADAAWPC